MLEVGVAISKIAKEVNIKDKQFIELSMIMIWFNKLYFDTNERFSQYFKTDNNNLL